MVIELIPQELYETVGILVVWTFIGGIAGGLVYFFSSILMKNWTRFWESLHNKQWEDCEPGEYNTYPSTEELRKSWIFRQIAHPIQYGIRGPNWEEYKKQWSETIEDSEA